MIVLIENYEEQVPSVSTAGNKTNNNRELNPDTLIDNYGCTPLHWCVINGHENLVKYFYNVRKCDAKLLKDKDGETAIEMAERRALCANSSDRGTGSAASLYGSIAKLLGGARSTKDLKGKLKQ